MNGVCGVYLKSYNLAPESPATVLIIPSTSHKTHNRETKMAHLMKRKHDAPKSRIVEWLHTIPWEDSFWVELKSYAIGPEKNWKKFGNLIRKRWTCGGS